MMLTTPTPDARQTIYAVTAWYLPGCKGGGPIRSVANLVEHLGGEWRFKVVAADRDFGDATTYAGVITGQWTPVGQSDVYYASLTARPLRQLQDALAGVGDGILYLNSLFNPTFSLGVLLLRRLGRIPSGPVIVAPRGELCPGALQLKAGKKRLCLAVGKALGLFHGILWQATNPKEVADIKAVFGEVPVLLAPNLPSRSEDVDDPSARPKAPGRLKAAFLSRISRKKNLHYALDLLAQVPGEIDYDIYGPVEDTDYWRDCEALIARLPARVQVRYCGPIAHEQVAPTLRRYHALLLPTLSENFGHVIVEAFQAGCLPIISDQTPWRMLADRQLGWDLPLADPTAFVDTLAQCIAMDQATFNTWSTQARAFSRLIGEDPALVAQSSALFDAAWARRG
jgi:glycosyltransferase involved in cell wall biosynthesis